MGQKMTQTLVLCPKLKIWRKEKIFASIKAIQVNTEKVVNTVKKENFWKWSQKWKHNGVGASIQLQGW